MRRLDGSRRIGAAGGFASLCVLLGSRWLLESGHPGTASTYVSQAIGDVLAAGAFGTLALIRKRQTGAVVGSRSWLTALAGLLVLCGPALGAAIAGRSLGSGNATLALALVPVVVAVTGAGLSGDEDGEMVGYLWPGLAGLAGLLLLLPEPSFNSLRAWIGLGAVPILTGWGVTMFVQSQGEPEDREHGFRVWGATISCLAASLVMAAVGLRDRPPITMASSPLEAAGLDAVTAFAMLFLLGKDDARRFSAFYLLVPLVTMLEGVFLLHPVLDARSWIGFGLLLVSSARLLFGRQTGSVPSLTLGKPGRVPPA